MSNIHFNSRHEAEPEQKSVATGEAAAPSMSLSCLPCLASLSELNTPAALRLSSWGLIRARGSDAAAFLHTQLTQDIKSLTPGTARLAGYCSPKGRLLASFVLWQEAPDDILMACSTDLLAPTLKRLSMFVLRADCKLSDASTEFALWGVAIPLHTATGVDADAAKIPGLPHGTYMTGSADAGTSIRLPDAVDCARLLWAAPPHQTPPAAWSTPLAPDVWEYLEVCSGVPRIVAATADAFVPQMVNLELLDGVNFQKGCYPGQEIVARSQYRGTLKRRMYLTAGDSPAETGTEVFSEADPLQPAGRVVLAATLRGATRQWHVALVEAKRSLVEMERPEQQSPASSVAALHLTTANGPRLHLQPLPYTLPVDAA